MTDTLFTNDDRSKLLFEAVAVIGLTLNAFVTAETTPLTGDALHFASIFLFGVGAIGLGTLRATKHSHKSDFRSSSAVYGGLTIALVTSGVFAALVTLGRFNNLLALLLLGGSAVAYSYWWSRFKTYDRENLPLSPY